MNAKEKPLVVSVVRDFGKYSRCLRENGNLAGCELLPVDNRADNDFIGVCYNRVLSSLPDGTDRWLVFCHEDFEFGQPVVPFLEDLTRDALYGPIGAVTVCRFGVHYQWQMRGQIEECDKDGSHVRNVGVPIVGPSVVDTLDCQCLIVHSSLAVGSALRFDEQLSFDLYVEDFCIAAKERRGILTMAVPLRCRHWSGGAIEKRYYRQVGYLREKWPAAAYTGTAYQLIGGGGAFLWRVEVGLKQCVQRMLRTCSHIRGAFLKHLKRQSDMAI